MCIQNLKTLALHWNVTFIKKWDSTGKVFLKSHINILFTTMKYIRSIIHQSFVTTVPRPWGKAVITCHLSEPCYNPSTVGTNWWLYHCSLSPFSWGLTPSNHTWNIFFKILFKLGQLFWHKVIILALPPQCGDNRKVIAPTLAPLFPTLPCRWGCSGYKWLMYYTLSRTQYVESETLYNAII